MSLAGGLIGAVLMGALSVLLLLPATANLDGTAHLMAVAVLVATSILAGLVAGSAVLRRAASRQRHLGLFSGIAVGVASGVVGAVFAVTILAAYISSYSAWPPDLLDEILMVLAFPVLGALGFCVGSLVGGLAGLVTGGVLRIAVSVRR